MPTPEPPPSRSRLLGDYDYPASHRAFELVCCAVFGVLFILAAARVVGGFAAEVTVARIAFGCAMAVLAYAVADLMSGVVHYLFDTFWTPDTPVIGQKFVKPFRDHHDDPAAMTRGDFVAVNGDNLFVCLPVLAPSALWLDARQHVYVAAFVLTFVIAVMLTNQIHKWTHLRQGDVPRTVRMLQARGLILSRERHMVHHVAPFRSDYCITWGKLNPLLNALVRHPHGGSEGG